MTKIVFLADLFAEDYIGGAELTTEALIDSCPEEIIVEKIRCKELTEEHIERLKQHHFIICNFSQLSQESRFLIAKNLNYSIIEYDYKFCDYRSPELHYMQEGETCNCPQKKQNKINLIFYGMAKKIWFMSEKQKEIFLENVPTIKEEFTETLSSVFTDNDLNLIKSLQNNIKNEKFLILKGGSWVKGFEQTLEYAVNNSLNYEIVEKMQYHDLLKKMSSSKGLIFMPKGSDTCPRLVIEAKLLGCELILNDNVQHRQESWFSSRESIVSYLKERKKAFWDYYKNIKNIKFIITVPFYNVEKYIKKCIRSIKQQTYKNFVCLLTNDLSEDNSLLYAKEEVGDDERFIIVDNKIKKDAMENTINMINLANPDRENVIVNVDGDDWLASSDVLQIVADTYNKKDILMTYGNYEMYPSGQKGHCSLYPDYVIENNLYRKDIWRASQLRTYKYKLWEKIEEKDLKHPDGSWMFPCADQTYMLPMLEMSGGKFHFFEEILYIYNRETSLSADKTKRVRQLENERITRSRKPYNKLY